MVKWGNVHLDLGFRGGIFSTQRREEWKQNSLPEPAVSGLQQDRRRTCSSCFSSESVRILFHALALCTVPPSFPRPPSSSALLQPFPSSEGRALTLNPLPQPCRNEPLPSKNLSFPHRGGEGDLICPLFVGCFPLAAAPQRLSPSQGSGRHLGRPPSPFLSPPPSPPAPQPIG